MTTATQTPLVQPVAETIKPEAVKSVISKHILRDGMDMIMDLDRSEGVYVHDSLTNRNFLDFFTCFATIPIGYNHPKMHQDKVFLHHLMQAALINPTNSDIYTTSFAHFIETFSRVGIPDYLPHAFFIAGGTLGVENAIKIAMDWKVQKNFQKGYRVEKGTYVLHFEEAFHGRSGYCLSLTNTDPTKIKYFEKFHHWPRVINPKIVFPNEGANHEDLEKREKLSIKQIERAFKENKDDICAIIIEPIQCEGGDNHFRKSFFEKLREICDENDALLIYDEVQVGVSVTGKFWCHQHFGEKARPDLVAFGKKMQVCGVLAGGKVDEIETNCFTVSSRINSTWGGNLVDMVRAYKILEIIEQDNLTEQAAKNGKYFLEKLSQLFENHPKITNLRGRGYIIAFDMPDVHYRSAFINKGFDNGALFIGCGPKSIRLRPALTMTQTDIDAGLQIIDKTLSEIGL